MSATTCFRVPSEVLEPTGQPPSLLPFHIAFSGPAPVSTYFLPRPAPVDPHAPSAEPLLLSTFRGRQVVGQSLRVPEGYAGVVLRIPPLPVASSSSPHSRRQTSDPAQLFNTPDFAPDTAADLADASRAGLRRSPRKRIIATTAVARLPPAKKARVAAKKFQLDSDSESEDEEPVVAAAALENTPSLVSVATSLTNPSLSTDSVVTPVGSVVGEEVTNAADADLTQGTLEVTETIVVGASAVEAKDLVIELPAATEASSQAGATEDDVPIEATTADEPYTVDQLLPSASSATDNSAVTRLITPLSTFETIALWTADDAVDPGRDEFYRCLGKGGWLDMSRVIHEEEDDDGDDE